MLRRKPIRILGIDPGTKETGVALLEGDELLYFGVKTLKRQGKRVPRYVLDRARRQIMTMIERYQPQVLAMEKTFVIKNRNSALLNVLADEIKVLARGEGLKINEYTPTTVKKLICGTGKATKKEVARKIASYYPELKRYLDPGKGLNRCKEGYWQNMFNAVALCLTHWAKNRRRS